MERGQKKSDTGFDHLERNDFILQKQENEKKRLEAEKRKILEEKDEAENKALIAMEEQDDADKQRKELFSLNIENKDWKDKALSAISMYLVVVDNTIQYCVSAIIDYAYSGTGGRGGQHGDFLYDEESSTIKRLMDKLANFAKVTIHVIADWLIWTANALGEFNDWEMHRAEREVKSIADGNYDWRIQRCENANGIKR